MAASLGQKHTCFVCSAKFYDLEQPEPVCPKCGENQKLAPKDAHKKVAKAKASRKKKATKKKATDTDSKASKKKKKS